MDLYFVIVWDQFLNTHRMIPPLKTARVCLHHHSSDQHGTDSNVGTSESQKA